MIKEAVRGFFKLFGLEVKRAVPTQSKRTDRLSFHKTKTGDYYLPTDARGDIVANTIIAGNVFEPDVIELARQFVKPGTTVLDVGANFGQMSVLFAEMVGQNGKVFSFEADTFIYEILNKNIAANNKTDVIQPVFGAVHNGTDEYLFFPEQDFERFGTYGSYGIDYNNKQEGRKVKTVKIDSINFNAPVSFMKVDVQGGDLFAMEGAVNTINKYKMPILFEYEYHFQEQFNYRFQEYVDFVASINYKFDKVLNGHNFLILPK
jgi:FkbM family methyltransferase